ncbi:hypothetical protein BGZ70_001618 [Mortierella alpina]|uniref:Uncharacterized protein n=1 Tax=Mortierella alpina TaxID=64518 RepID=A0A9P6M524_MORAP|nr:hypothetical protein BGZ70_001618 [Mortierella alpina]
MANTDEDRVRTRVSQQDTESTTVDMTGMIDMGLKSAHVNPASVEYANPFQQPQPLHRSQEHHYSIQIPTINHWPTLFTQYARKGARFIHENVQRLKYHSYHSIPSRDNNHNPFRRSSFGSRRFFQKAGHTSSCSGRRFNRILILLGLYALIMTWAFLPALLRRPQDRNVWVRFFDHDEPVKVVLPPDRKMQVYDVKKHAIQEMDYRYSSYNPETVRLLAAHSLGLLRPDDVWDNTLYPNSARDPIIAIETGHELIDHLNQTLGCFSTSSAFYYDRFKSQFHPEFDDYQQLYNILQNMHDNRPLQNWQIRYLRQAINDPLQDEALYGPDFWVRPKNWYDQPSDYAQPTAYAQPTYHAQDIESIPVPEWNTLPPEVGGFVNK